MNRPTVSMQRTDLVGDVVDERIDGIAREAQTWDLDR